jgi:lysophospholipase L1-like esterase
MTQVVGAITQKGVTGNITQKGVFGSIVHSSSGMSWDAYWATRLDMWMKDRAASIISEPLKDNTPAIVPSIASFNGTDTLVSFPNVAGYNFSGDFYIYIPVVSFGTIPVTKTIMAKDNSTAAVEWRLDVTATGRLWFSVFHGNSTSNQWKIETGTGVANSNTTIYNVLCSYKAADRTGVIYVNGVLKTGNPTTTGTMSSVTSGAAPIGIGAIPRTTPSLYLPGKVGGTIMCGAEYVTDYNAISTHFFKAPICGTGVYEFDVTGGSTGTWVGTAPHFAYNASGSRYVFDYGFKIYEKAGQSDVQVPAGASVTVIAAAGYTLKATYPANTSYINKNGKALLNFNYLNLTAGGFYNVVCEGDSLTEGYGATAGNTYPELLVAKYLADDAIKITATNMGVGGQTVATMIVNASTTIDPLLGDYKRALIFWGGVNDLGTSATAETVYQRILTYCTARKAAGWNVFACTILPQDHYTSILDFEDKRVYVNNKIRTELIDVVDGIIDFTTDENIGQKGDETNLTYYNADKIHLTDAGYAIVANMVYAGIKTFIVANKHVGLASIAMFNKNDSTIHIATGGMDYVDTANYYLWRLDELSSYAKYNSYFNEAYQDILFTKVEDDLLKEMLVCLEKQTGGAVTKAKTYCGIT